MPILDPDITVIVNGVIVVVVGLPDGVKVNAEGPRSMNVLDCAVRTATVPVINPATLGPEVPTVVAVNAAEGGVKFPV
jgi:hypothetical protein